MKTSRFTRRLAVALGAISLSLSAALAADTSSPAAAASTSDVTASATVTASADTGAPKLPYGADDVLKLSRAQVSEDIIQNYIANSGTVYNLNPNEIVYLRSQGVSDRVINSMLDQKDRATEVAAAASAPTDNTAPNATANGYNATSPVYQAPPPTYTPPPQSSVYVMSYPQVSSAYYGYSYPSYYYSYPSYGCYPYYGYYGGYCGSPVISFGFGYGRGWGGWGGWGRSHYYGGHFGGHFGGGWHHR